MKWHRLICLLKGHREGYPMNGNDPFRAYKSNTPVKRPYGIDQGIRVRWAMMQVNEGTGGHLTQTNLRYCDRCGDAFIEVC